MKKLLLTISICLLIAGNVFAAQAWRSGTAENSILGTSNAADIDENTFQKIVYPLDLLMKNYKEGVKVKFANSETLTVTAGDIVVRNASGTIRLMVQTTTDTTVAWTEIDTGAEAGSTTYYVYAVVDAVTDTDFRVEISTSSTEPDSETYYRRLGSFYNDANSNITQIVNDNSESLRIKVSKSVGTTYQAATDGIVTASIYGGSASGGVCDLIGYTDNATAPTTRVGSEGWGVTGDKQDWGGGFSFPVLKGNYYKTAISQVSGTCSGYSTTMYFTPSY